MGTNQRFVAFWVERRGQDVALDHSLLLQPVEGGEPDAGVVDVHLVSRL